MSKLKAPEPPKVQDHGRALYRTVQYLSRAEQNCEYDSVRYFLDWDLLQEAIYPHRAASVYSPLVWCALECLEASSRKGDEWKPYLPEGTRVELLRHLAQITATVGKDSIPKPKRSIDETERLLGTLPLAWRRPEWKEVLEQIQRALRAHEAVGLLFLIVSKYTQPGPSFDHDELVREQHTFERRLGRLRSKATNIADAQNLATISLLSPVDATQTHEKATLVSASMTVWRASESTTADPFAFMVDAYYRRYQPDPFARRKLLRSLIADVYKLLNQVEFMTPPPSEQSEHLLREETPDFLLGLDTLDNVALQELGRLLSIATQSVHNARSQARELSSDIWPEDLSGLDDLTFLKRKTQLLRDKITPNELEANELEWRQVFQSAKVNRFTLLSGSTELLEVQVGFGEITCSWQTRRSLSEFLAKLSSTTSLPATFSAWDVGVRLPNTPGLKESVLSTEQLTVPAIADIAAGKKIVFVRLSAGPTIFWYSVVNHSRHMEVSRSGNHHAKVSVRLPINGDHHLIAELFDDTGYEWYYPAAVLLKLSELSDVKCNEGQDVR